MKSKFQKHYYKGRSSNNLQIIFNIILLVTYESKDKKKSVTVSKNKLKKTVMQTIWFPNTTEALEAVRDKIILIHENECITS